MPPEVVVSRDEFEGLKAQQATMQYLLQEMHDALMKKQPGEDRSLLDRMAAVTNSVESGAKTARLVIWMLGFLAAVGVSVKIGAIK